MTASAPIQPSVEAPVLVETSRALPLVAITVASRAGSLLDPPGKDGLTRLVARLMRRTAGGLAPQQIDVRIDSLGGALGIDSATSTVSFHGTVIARSLDPFVDLFSDVLCKPGLAEAELGRLKRETQSDIVESRDNDRTLARRWFRRRLFDGHPYGRSATGTIPSLEAVDITDVRDHYRRLFGHNQLVFAFAGDVDREQAERIASRLSASLGRTDVPADAAPEPNGPKGRHLIFVDKPERTQTQILIGGLGTHPRDPDHIALHVANTIFGGTFTARLTQEVRAKRGWSYGAYSSLPYDRHRQAFSMWTFPKAEDAAPCIKLELEMLHKWRERGVTKKELSWAKRYLVRSHAFAVDTASKRVSLALDEEIYNLPAGYHSEYTEHVKAVTLEQANEAVQTRISERDLLIAVVGTERQIGQAVRDAVGELDYAEVVPFDAD